MSGYARLCPVLSLVRRRGDTSVYIGLRILKLRTRNKAKCVVPEPRTRLARAGSLIPKDLWKFKIQSEANNETAIRGATRIGPAVLDLTANASSGANQGSRDKACRAAFPVSGALRCATFFQSVIQEV
jgi:hypothetical protein